MQSNVTTSRAPELGGHSLKKRCLNRIIIIMLYVHLQRNALGETHISDRLLGLFFSISCLLNRIFHFSLDLNEVSLQLLLGVDKAGILNKIIIWITYYHFQLLGVSHVIICPFFFKSCTRGEVRSILLSLKTSEGQSRTSLPDRMMSLRRRRVNKARHQT